MNNVKVIGAGSIGNHLSHASRALGWAVDICDIDAAALERTKTSIYPSRYGQWDEAINLYSAAKVPQGVYDLIVIGTPPDSHMELALAAVREKPKAVLVEKPLCTPALEGAEELLQLAKENNVAVFTGYDHIVGASSQKVTDLLQQNYLTQLVTLDVEFREYWGGIFAAHPWLDGPGDSYLGFWQRGGGASGEHSHALNLWQHFAQVSGAGRVTEVNANLEYYKDETVHYDKLCLLNLTTESGLMGRVVQDVVTEPSRKWARLQADKAFIEWHCSYEPGCDAVIAQKVGKEPELLQFHKTRPDDFIQELKHIETAVAGDASASPISLQRGLETMLVIAAAHKSAQEKRTVTIDYEAYGI